MRNRFLWTLVVVLVQTGCSGGYAPTPTEPLELPPAPAPQSAFQLSVLVTSFGRCLPNAQIQIVAPANIVGPVALQTADFCSSYDNGYPYAEPILFGFAVADDQWPITVATSAEGYAGKRVEVSREQVESKKLLVIDLTRQ